MPFTQNVVLGLAGLRGCHLVHLPGGPRARAKTRLDHLRTTTRRSRRLAVLEAEAVIRPASTWGIACWTGVELLGIKALPSNMCSFGPELSKMLSILVSMRRWRPLPNESGV